MAGEKKRSGWVKINRGVQDHWVWDEKPFSKGQAWIDLILLARHSDGTFMDRRGNLIEGKRGGVYRSERSLAERWEWSRKKTSNFLSRLVQDNMIEMYKENAKAETMIFIVNYDNFQSAGTNDREFIGNQLGFMEGRNREQNGASEGATARPDEYREIQIWGASREPVESQSRASREPVRNIYKNDKNEKNDKNDKEERDIVAPGGSTPTHQADYGSGSFEMQCVEHLIASCLESFPKAKVPDTLAKKNKWALEIEKMKRLDHLSEAEIKQALIFATSDSFWKTNIRSTKKFREKFETLYTQSQTTRGKSSNALYDTADRLNKLGGEIGG